MKLIQGKIPARVRLWRHVLSKPKTVQELKNSRIDHSAAVWQEL